MGIDWGTMCIVLAQDSVFKKGSHKHELTFKKLLIHVGLNILFDYLVNARRIPFLTQANSFSCGGYK